MRILVIRCAPLHLEICQRRRKNNTKRNNLINTKNRPQTHRYISKKKTVTDCGGCYLTWAFVYVYKCIRVCIITLGVMLRLSLSNEVPHICMRILSCDELGMQICHQKIVFILSARQKLLYTRLHTHYKINKNIP